MSALRDALPAVPTECSRETAAAYHVRLLELLEVPTWTRSERASLQRLEKRWRRRAMGRDGRWLLRGAGDKGGRLPAEVEATITTKRKRHFDWSELP